MPSVAALHHIGNDPTFRSACTALAGATVRDYGNLVVGMDATATAVGGRWGGNAPLLQGNVTPGLYRAIMADGGALWWVIQAFNRTTFNAALSTYPALSFVCQYSMVQPIDHLMPIDQELFHRLPDRVTYNGRL